MFIKQLLILVILLLVLYRVFRPQIKGYIGEKIIAFVLKRLDKEKYTVINDVMVEVERGTSQIDHVIVSNFGVFVVETKNYSGWIFGDDTSRYWTQVIYKRKEKFYNPIRQNLGHIKALKKVLADYPNLLYIPIVVFSINADLKTKTSNHVVYSTKLLKTIRRYDESVISDTEKKDIAQRLTGLNIRDRAARRTHVSDIKAFTEPKEVCPRCGQALVTRAGKYGKFIGCSGYPKCRFTAQIKK
jgi:RNA polymerase subunit RPABC4/transcription elongation factor Spt4